jgi:hypothetical protein
MMMWDSKRRSGKLSPRSLFLSSSTKTSRLLTQSSFSSLSSIHHVWNSRSQCGRRHAADSCICFARCERPENSKPLLQQLSWTIANPDLGITLNFCPGRNRASSQHPIYGTLRLRSTLLQTQPQRRYHRARAALAWPRICRCGRWSWIRCQELQHWR